MGLLTEESDNTSALAQKSCSLVDIPTNSYSLGDEQQDVCVHCYIKPSVFLERHSFIFLRKLLQSVSSVSCNAQIKYVTELPKYTPRNVHR